MSLRLMVKWRVRFRIRLRIRFKIRLMIRFDGLDGKGVGWVEDKV